MGVQKMDLKNDKKYASPSLRPVYTLQYFFTTIDTV